MKRGSAEAVKRSQHGSAETWKQGMLIRENVEVWKRESVEARKRGSVEARDADT